MNFRQLKDFCNSLPEKELDKQVVVLRESEPIKNINAFQMDEDQYTNPDDPDECLSKSEAEKLILVRPDYYHDLDDMQKVCDRGTPYLMEE